MDRFDAFQGKQPVGNGTGAARGRREDAVTPWADLPMAAENLEVPRVRPAAAGSGIEADLPAVAVLGAKVDGGTHWSPSFVRVTKAMRSLPNKKLRLPER